MYAWTQSTSFFFSNQTGTVLVKVTLVFQTNRTNPDVIKGLFIKAVAGGNEINSLKIKPEFPPGKRV